LNLINDALTYGWLRHTRPSTSRLENDRILASQA